MKIGKISQKKRQKTWDIIENMNLISLSLLPKHRRNFCEIYVHFVTSKNMTLLNMYIHIRVSFEYL